MLEGIIYELGRLYEKHNGKGRVATPSTFGGLKVTLQVTANAPNRYANLETREGQILLEEIQSLERILTQQLHSNPRDDDSLDDVTKERAEELLVRLDLLGYLCIGYALRKYNLRTRKSITDLLPQQMSHHESNDLDGGNAHGRASDMQLSET